MSIGPRLRILVVNWQDRENPQGGGAEEHLHQVFGRLARRGHRVTLLCSGWKGCAPTAEIDGIEVHRTGGRYTFNLAAPLYCQRHLADRAFDVAIEDLNKVPMLAPVWAGARTGLLLVHHLFGATAFREANPLLATATWLFERIIPVAYRGLPCVAVSQSTLEDLGRRGLDPSRIAVIRNGVELDGLGPAATRFADPTVVYLGRAEALQAGGPGAGCGGAATRTGQAREDDRGGEGRCPPPLWRTRRGGWTSRTACTSRDSCRTTRRGSCCPDRGFTR